MHGSEVGALHARELGRGREPVEIFELLPRGLGPNSLLLSHGVQDMTMCQRPVGDPCQKLLEESRICAGGIDQSYTAQEWNAIVEGACVQNAVQESELVPVSVEPEADMDLDQLFCLLKEPEKTLEDIVGQDETTLTSQDPEVYAQGVSPALNDASSSAAFSYYQSVNDYERVKGEAYVPAYGNAERVKGEAYVPAYGNAEGVKGEVYERVKGEAYVRAYGNAEGVKGEVYERVKGEAYDPAYGNAERMKGEVYDPAYGNATGLTTACESSWSYGNDVKSEVIEISDGEEDEVGVIGEKRKLPVSFTTEESKPSRSWWYAQEQTNASLKKDENGSAEVLNSDDDSDQRDERGGTTRRSYSSSDARANEDRNLRTILQRMITVDEKEEASPDDGLMTIPLLKHQRIALAWMEKSENRVECSGGILADDQGLGKTVSTIALILKARAPVSKLNFANSETALIESELVDLDEDEDGDKDDDECSQKLDDRKPALGRGRKTGGTLVICPTSVLRQWAHEIKAKVTPAANLSILVYHGSSRTRSADDLAKYDVVLTTYPIVSMEVPKQLLPEEKEEDKRNYDDYGLGGFRFSKKKSKSKKRLADEKIPESGPLAKVSWFRVVLDEAQSIKNSRTQVARACWGLRAKKRWCLSGTPIQNAIDDLYSYFRFLRFDPLDTYKAFRSEVKDPIVRNPVLGYKKLQLILQVVMLRRTKTTLIDGQPIVNLPPRVVNLQEAEFSDDERVFYQNLENESRKQFQVYAEEGTLQSNYVNILYMLLRLRQACDHPLLVKETNNESTEFDGVENVKKLPLERRVELQNTLDRSKSICTICADVPEWAVISWCGHVFCRQCISEKLATSDDTECPFPKCTIQLNSSLLYSLTALRNCNLGIDSSNNNATKVKKKRQATDQNPDAWTSSSKIEAVMRLLKSLPVKTPGDGKDKKPETEKAIVFSQWTSMLDLLEPQLRKAGLRFSRLDGTMTVMERDSAVSEFNTNPEVSVMIMSLKAASLGLNMVAACHVLLLDVWWNPTTEDQAIDRAHRIGQTRTVYVSRFTVKNTIEDRILALQERKKQMVSSAFGENEGNNQKSRLTMDDIRFLFSG